MSIELGQGEIILSVRPSPFRRWVSVVLVIGLAAFLVHLALTESAISPLSRGILGLLGLGCAWMGVRMYHATDVGLDLYPDRLCDTKGQELCHLDELAKVERGAFAFKPSNGLVLQLKDPGRAAWQPGLWWRIGRRLGIGGIISAGQSKALAEAITLLQRERNDPDGTGSLL